MFKIPADQKQNSELLCLMPRENTTSKENKTEMLLFLNLHKVLHNSKKVKGQNQEAKR